MIPVQVGRFQDCVGDLEIESVALFLTDVPYNMDFPYGPVDDDLPPEEYRAVLRDLVALTYPKAREGASMFIIHYPEAIAAHWDVLTGNGWQFHQWLTWTYNAHSPMPPEDRLRRSSRAVLWLSKGPPKVNASHFPSSYRNPTDRRIREAIRNGQRPRATDVIHVEQVKQGSKEHLGYANQIPAALLKPFIMATTEPGDLVADPFSGTGSTARAALALGRRAWGCDANPEAARFWADLETRQLVLAVGNLEADR